MLSSMLWNGQRRIKLFKRSSSMITNQYVALLNEARESFKLVIIFLNNSYYYLGTATQLWRDHKLQADQDASLGHLASLPCQLSQWLLACFRFNRFQCKYNSI